jgi:hypothetical protein
MIWDVDEFIDQKALQVPQNKSGADSERRLDGSGFGALFTPTACPEYEYKVLSLVVVLIDSRPFHNLQCIVQL